MRFVKLNIVTISFICLFKEKRLQNDGRSKPNPSLQRARNFQRVSGIISIVVA